MRTNPQLVLLAVALGALAPAACSGSSNSTYGFGGQGGASGAQGGGVAAGGTLSGGSGRSIAGSSGIVGGSNGAAGSGGETTGGVAGASAGSSGSSGTAGGGTGPSGGVGGNGDAGAPTGGASGSSGNTGTAGNAGSGGAAGNAGFGGAAGNAGAGGASGSAGSAGSGGGGTTCSTKVLITAPLLTDFESYDGSTPPESWSFSYDDVYGGVFGFNDGTGTPSFAMFAGASSNWAIGAGNTLSSAWGGGLGVWAFCFDASAFEGLSFMVRGLAPQGVALVSLQMEDTTPVEYDGSCTAGTLVCSQPVVEVPVSADWSLVQIPWSAFTPGVGSGGVAVPANGDEISSVSFVIQLNFVETDAGAYEPVPGPYQLTIDDLGFF